MKITEIIPASDPHLRKFGVDQAFIDYLKQVTLENPQVVGEAPTYNVLQMYFLVKSNAEFMPVMGKQIYNNWAPAMYKTVNNLPEQIKDQCLKIMKATEDLIK
jgi:hypothetical protein